MEGEGGGVVANWSWRAAFGLLYHTPLRGMMLWKRWRTRRFLNNVASVRPLAGPDIDVSLGRRMLRFENGYPILQNKSLHAKEPWLYICLGHMQKREKW